LLGGFALRSPQTIALSGALFILLGLTLMIGEEIEINKAESYLIEDVNDTHDKITPAYVILTKDTDTLVDIFHYLFFYGGFALIAISFLVYYRERNMVIEDEAE